MNIIGTIVPIFAVIALGWGARQKGMLPPEFLGTANRLVFYLAIPAMVFSAIAKASLQAHFNGAVAVIILAVMVATCALAWLAASLSRMARRQRGAFIEDSFHGNQGYIGLAVAFYFLGPDGLARASILTGFMMILNNVLGVVVLQVHADAGEAKRGNTYAAGRIAGNPVILSALAGILFALSGARLPAIIDRSLAIVSGMALPLALLIIGGSLSVGLLKSRFYPVLAACLLKLVVMPAVGLGLFLLWGVSTQDFLPGLILLATPTATVAYVLARQMKGDADFAVVAISLSTLLSALTYTGWLAVASRL